MRNKKKKEIKRKTITTTTMTAEAETPSKTPDTVSADQRAQAKEETLQYITWRREQGRGGNHWQRQWRGVGECEVVGVGVDGGRRESSL